MDYKLAKELKEVGFNQRVANPIYISIKGGGSDGPRGTELESTYARVPTLSELIEACGETFAHLEHDPNGKWHCNWSKSEGSTAEEAVAKLWLKINKNG